MLQLPMEQLTFMNKTELTVSSCESIAQIDEDVETKFDSPEKEEQGNGENLKIYDDEIDKSDVYEEEAVGM